MPAETLAEQVSELIWANFDDRRSNGDPITFTQFIKDSHEVALQLLSEFPDVKLAPGEYLDENAHEPGSADESWTPSPELIAMMAKTRWTSIYKARTLIQPSRFVLNREYNPQANDLIVARDFPNVEAMQAFIEEEVQEAIHQEFRAMTSATGPKATGWYRQRSDTNIHKIGIVFDGLGLVPDDNREFGTEEEAVAFLKKWQTEMAKLDVQAEERRRRAVD